MSWRSVAVYSNGRSISASRVPVPSSHAGATKPDSGQPFFANHSMPTSMRASAYLRESDQNSPSPRV